MLWFILGAFFGGFIGVCAMCLFVMSGNESRSEEKRNIR